MAFSESIINTCIKYRWGLFTCSCLLFLALSFGLNHFRFDSSPRIYFEEGYQPYEEFVELEDTYGREYKIFIMLSIEDGDLFSPENLTAIDTLTNIGWELPYVGRVDSLTNFQFTYSEDDDLIVDNLFSEESFLDTVYIDERKQFALNSPETLNRLISADGKHAAIVYSLTVTGEQSQGSEGRNLVSSVYTAIETLQEQHPSINFAVSGNIVAAYHNFLTAERDTKLMVPAMFGLMFILLGALLRSISCIMVSFVVAIFASIAALGLGAWCGITYSLLSINALIISITVSVAHCIHIFTQMFHELKSHGKMQAFINSLNINFFAISITSLTTVIGFLSLNASDLPPAGDLGNVAAMGTALAWLFSLTVLPALVSILPFKVNDTSEFFIERQMLKLAEFIIQHKHIVFISMLMLSGLMIYLSFSNALNDNLTKTLHEPHIFRSDNDLIDEHFGVLYINNYDMNAGEEYGITSPQYLQNMDKFVTFLRAQPEVSSVYAFSDIIKRLNQSMHNDDPAFYTIPDDKALIAQYVLLYEMSVPYGLDLSNQITMDKSKSIIIVSMPSQDTSTNIEVDQRVNQWITNNLPEQLKTKNLSISTIWSYLTISSLVSSLEGSFVALLLISIVLLFLLKSFYYGLISLIPNILPAVFGFGLWYLYSGEVGIALTSVAILTIGIVVDDTVHFLSKYKTALQAYGNAEDAIRATFKQVGSALIVTTLVLAMGFAVLGLSDIITNSALGQVTAAILLSAFVLDILLLPVLLLFLDKPKSNAGHSS